MIFFSVVSFFRPMKIQDIGFFLLIWESFHQIAIWTTNIWHSYLLAKNFGKLRSVYVVWDFKLVFFFILPVKPPPFCFKPTNPNVQECTQPENTNKNKKLPARIFFLKKKKNAWESNTFLLYPVWKTERIMLRGMASVGKLFRFRLTPPTVYIQSSWNLVYS